MLREVAGALRVPRSLETLVGSSTVRARMDPENSPSGTDPNPRIIDVAHRRGVTQSIFPALISAAC